MRIRGGKGTRPPETRDENGGAATLDHPKLDAGDRGVAMKVESSDLGRQSPKTRRYLFLCPGAVRLSLDRGGPSWLLPSHW